MSTKNPVKDSKETNFRWFETARRELLLRVISSHCAFISCTVQFPNRKKGHEHEIVCNEQMFQHYLSCELLPGVSNSKKLIPSYYGILYGHVVAL